MGESKIKDFLKKVFSNNREEPLEDGKDYVLESLRRENQYFDDEEEKQYLKSLLKERKRDRVRKYMFGVKDESVNKEVNILQNVDMSQNKILNNGRRVLGQQNMFQDRNKILNQPQLLRKRK